MGSRTRSCGRARRTGSGYNDRSAPPRGTSTRSSRSAPRCPWSRGIRSQRHTCAGPRRPCRVRSTTCSGPESARSCLRSSRMPGRAPRPVWSSHQDRVPSADLLRPQPSLPARGPRFRHVHRSRCRTPVGVGSPHAPPRVRRVGPARPRSLAAPLAVDSDTGLVDLASSSLRKPVAESPSATHPASRETTVGTSTS